MSRRIGIVGLAGLIWSLWCGTSPAVRGADEPAAEIRVPSVIEPEPLRKDVTFLASPDLEGRGTVQGRRRAIAFLRKRFEDLGLQPAFPDSYLQEVPGVRQEDGTLPIWGMNVAAVLPGNDPQLKDEVIILAAHYDHLGIRDNTLYPGADDNASSVSLMLQVARELSRTPKALKRTVAFVAFDLEEHLLWGSRWFAGHTPWPLEKVKLFITADLLGRPLGDMPLNAVFVMGSERCQGMPAYLKRLQPPGELELARLGADIVGTRSDYGPFRDEKVPFLFFSSGEHPGYHTPEDTADRLDYHRLANISNVVLQIVKHFADARETPDWVADPKPDLDEVRAIQRVTTLLLDAEQEGTKKFSSLQRFIITQTHQKTQQLLQQGELKPADRGWLVRSAQALLYTVF